MMKAFAVCCLLATLAAAQRQTMDTSCNDGTRNLWRKYECQNRMPQANVAENCQLQVMPLKPEPVKEAGSELPAKGGMTLWGVTLGDVPAAYPDCPARRFVMQDAPTCSKRSRITPESLMVYNLIYKGGIIPVDLNIKGSVVNSLSAQILECQVMSESLTKKLGEATHESQPMMSGGGVHWTADIWSWKTEDGSEAILTNRLHDMTDSDCWLLALSPSAAAERKKSVDATTAAEP